MCRYDITSRSFCLVAGGKLSEHFGAVPRLVVEDSISLLTPPEESPRTDTEGTTRGMHIDGALLEHNGLGR